MNHRQYQVTFPEVHLDKDNGERISAFEMVMHCGRFRALQRIPDDWSMEVIGPVSEETKLKASAGHGTAWLWSVHDLDGLITVQVCETDCFDIKATVFSETGDKERKHVFTKTNLVLKAVRKDSH